MPDIDIGLLGDKVLERRMWRLDQKVQKSFVQSATWAAAVPVEATAKQKAPVLTGRMRDSIKRYPRTRKGQPRTEVRTGTRAQLGIPESELYYYPTAVEFGHKNVPAHSFLRAALVERAEEVKAIMGKIMWSKINQFAATKGST